MDRINVQGCQLEVQHIASAGNPGSLAPLVFLHEGLGSAAMWRDWPRAVCVATGRAGWVYSRRGYGRSDPVADVRTGGRLPADYLHREAFDVLPALLAELALHAPVLLGHSDGASIALLHASRFPVRACIAMAPHVVVEEVSIRAIEAARQAFLDGALRDRLARYHADVDGAFWQWNDVWLSQAFSNFDIRADCTRIAAPVLAIQGVDDPYGTLAQIEQIHLPTEQIQRLVLPACGHSPHRDAPEETLRHVTAFLSRLG